MAEQRVPQVSHRIAAANAAVRMRLPFDDTADFDEARRGLVASLSDGVIRGTDGRVVWDADAYGFLDDECPETVNPSLWRQGQLNAIHGLFEVTEGIYQVRGLDLSNMTIVEGDEGVLVIDPLISTETAAAALALYRAHRGERPVTGLLYTHCHIDHFGGARGVVSEADVATGRIPVIAPEGFLQHAVSENVYAGGAMSRRATYMYGALLPKGPAGQVGAGLGQTTSLGTLTLIPPTVDIVRTGQEEVVDGIRMVFQMTPGTEAPAEMNFFFPDRKALCMAENATHNLHNIVTLRGALVRDPHVWAGYLDEAIALFGADAEVLFAQHHWPRWGTERIVDFLAKQRDLYGYIHDQSLRLINRGLGPAEIAEQLELPPSLEREWHCRGYYGSLSHNVKAVYQRYLGWFDANPAHLWPHPPQAAAERYVALGGGPESLLAHAREAFAQGDYRWVAELVNHLVFADPDNSEAKELQAQALEQLAFGAENGTWRNFFLMGARELREGVGGTATATAPRDIVRNLAAEHLFDAMAIRLDGPRAGDREITLHWIFTDTGHEHELTLRHGVLTHRRDGRIAEPDATVRIARAAFDSIVDRSATIEDIVTSGSLVVEGNAAKLGELLGLLEDPDPAFPIVTP
ncbi:MAG TPA: alkyl sulfatase dimerization domain-containing protein [Conexibacter sp.]|jgi:alkyl sulfatase BDS1-like metallo-beta-lactamase superfamily hydrolase|nr:alkyl sulfatase dimerization domain-containing protein [Conexibacter sp.]